MATVSEIIQQNQVAILDQWTRSMADASFARGLSPDELAGGIPAYLVSLGRVEEEPGAPSPSRQELVEAHLSRRLRQGANLNEILTELASLMRCVSSFLDVEGVTRRPSFAQAAWLSEELRLVAEASARIFNEHMLEDQQDEKRHARRLREIAAQANFADPPSLRRRLHEALAVIIEAMDAQSGAILLLDEASQQFTMAASEGDAREQLEKQLSSLDVSSLVGLIASRAAEPTAVDDVATTELEVSDELRGSGIHALLGVALSSRHLVRGVLYVGLRERRGFTASETRRLQGLGEAMAVELDNSRLSTALRLQIQAAATQDELHGRFVSTLVHDMRGPIVAAQRAARLLVDHPESVAGTPVQVVLDNLGRLESMVADLVDAQMVRADRPLPLHPAHCDLAAMASDCAEELSDAFGDRFKVTGDRPVEGIWSPDLLRRALWNLASNAVQFGARGTPVTIDVRRLATTVTLTVHNHGHVLTPAELALLVQPFASHRPARGQPLGWGLGLTLVWGCVEAHGGRVQVNSAEGQGTLFRMILPCDARPYSMDAS